MKKIMLSLFALLLLVSCTSKTSFEDKKSLLPSETKNAIDQFPNDIKDEILIPSKLLSENYMVEFGYTSEPANDPNGKIFQSFLIYTDEKNDWKITFMTYHMPSSPSSPSSVKTETVELKNGIKADYNEGQNGLQRAISWNDDDIRYSISLLENPKATKPKYTKEDLIEVVNSLK
jgi:hypothetical protein